MIAVMASLGLRRDAVSPDDSRGDLFGTRSTRRDFGATILPSSLKTLVQSLTRRSSASLGRAFVGDDVVMDPLLHVEQKRRIETARPRNP